MGRPFLAIDLGFDNSPTNLGFALTYSLSALQIQLMPPAYADCYADCYADWYSQYLRKDRDLQETPALETTGERYSHVGCEEWEFAKGLQRNERLLKHDFTDIQENHTKVCT